MKLVDPPGPAEEQPPATKQDIENLGDKLVWPPTFTRDNRLQQMQQLLDEQDKVMDDSSLTDTEKVLRVAELKQLYNVHDRELFDQGRIGAVPPKPLTHTQHKKVKADESMDDAEDSDASDTTVMAEPEEDSEDEEDYTAAYSREDLLSMVKPHRRAKTRMMLKKLGADGKLTWDKQGHVFYRGKRIPNANMGELVQYFQSARKRHPLSPPLGGVVFGQALRKAHAMDDVLLGGPVDDDIRGVFKGHSPKTPRFSSPRVAAKKVRFGKASHRPSSSPIKRIPQDDTKLVEDWEY